MKNFLCSLVFLAMTCSVVLSQQRAGNGSATPPAPASSIANWIKYSSPEGRYSVKLPVEPKLSASEASNPDGVKFMQYDATSYKSGALCMVGYFDLSASGTFSLNSARDGILERVKGTLLSEKPITLGSYPGREIKVSAVDDGTELLARIRMYQVKRRVYMVQFITIKSKDTPASATQAREYLDSFSVTTQ